MVINKKGYDRLLEQPAMRVPITQQQKKGLCNGRFKQRLFYHKWSRKIEF
jgi:hypothetical protein